MSLQIHNWPNRDPLTEGGFEVVRNNDSFQLQRFVQMGTVLQGLNLYEFVQNDPSDKTDYWGLQYENDVVKCMQRCDKFCKGMPSPSEFLKNCYNGCYDDPTKPPSPIPPPPAMPPSLPKRELWPLCKEIAKDLWDIWKNRKDIKDLPKHP